MLVNKYSILTHELLHVDAIFISHTAECNSENVILYLAYKA